MPTLKPFKFFSSHFSPKMRWVVVYSKVGGVNRQLGILKFVFAQDAQNYHVDLNKYFNLKNVMQTNILIWGVANYPLESYHYGSNITGVEERK